MKRFEILQELPNCDRDTKWQDSGVMNTQVGRQGPDFAFSI